MVSLGPGCYKIIERSLSRAEFFNLIRGDELVIAYVRHNGENFILKGNLIKDSVKKCQLSSLKPPKKKKK